MGAILWHMVQNDIDATSGMARDGTETASGAAKRTRPVPGIVFAAFVVLAPFGAVSPTEPRTWSRAIFLSAKNLKNQGATDVPPRQTGHGQCGAVADLSGPGPPEPTV